MSSYEFTLILDHAPSAEELDALFEAGCDDSTPETVAGSGWLHFDRAADTLLEALTSAIRDIESTGLAVCAVASNDLVSLKDIAARAGRTYESARLLASGKRGPGGFPPPVTTADGWSLYSWGQVAQWLHTNLLTEAVVEQDHRTLAAVDHMVRARCLLEDRENALTALADLLTLRGPRQQPAA
ncbi:MAG: hypothetical protein ACRDTX_01740 [Pseudonocardiaceae bacterium]